MPRFSILLPAFNVAPWVGETLASLLCQSFSDWECLCTDDGSSDGTAAIVDAAARDPRIRVIHTKNGGVAAARNRLLPRARGDFILFLDGDDLLHPAALALLDAAIRRHPRERLFRFDFRPFEQTLHREALPAAPEEHTLDLSQTIAFPDFYTFCFQYCIARDLVSGLTFPDYHYGEDRVFVTRLLLERTERLIRLPLPLYAYRQRPTSAVHTPPDLRGLRDELLHREEIARRTLRSPKHLNFANTFWFNGFFLFDLPKAIRSLPPAERAAARRLRRQTLRRLLALPLPPLSRLLCLLLLCCRG